MDLIEYNEIKDLIKIYFEQPQVLFRHLFDSYHQFIEEIIPYSLIEESNTFFENIVQNDIYIHGFRCKNVRVKPVTFDQSPSEIMFPKQARKNNHNYFTTIHVDIEQVVEKVNILTGERTTKVVATSSESDPIAVANVPVMVRSKYCSTSVKNNMFGECKHDPGGYFIVNGQEKIVMSIEKMVDNKCLVFVKKDASYIKGYFHHCQINSKSNDWSDNLQILTIKERKDGTFTISTSQLVEIPIVIFFRALGLESDQEIISNCCYDLDDINMVNLMKPSINMPIDENGNPIRTKDQAIEYLITKLRRSKRFSQTDEDLANVQKKIFLQKIFKKDLLPHEGEDITIKVKFLGRMLNKIFNVILERIEPDDRDTLQNKRIETPGVLLGQLFRQNWKKMLNEIGKNFKKKNQSDENPVVVINQIKPSVIEQNIKTALATGIWGMNKTKKGVAQSLQRLSWFKAISEYRRVMAPSLDAATSNVTSIRHVNNSQTQFLCPTETPEGQKIGVVKSLAMTSTLTTQNFNSFEVIQVVLDIFKNYKHPSDVDSLDMKNWGKVFINGSWKAVTKDLYGLFKLLKEKRREGLIDKFTSMCMDFQNKEICIYCDGGRLIRPILIVENNKLNMNKEVVKEFKSFIEKGSQGWNLLIEKHKDIIEYEDIESTNFLMIAETQKNLVENMENMNRKVELKDSSMINRYGDYRYVNYTHCDIHPWLMLGIIASSIPFLDHNYPARNIIFFNQAKQAIGIYMTSYKDRMDISQILYHPQVPIVTTEGMYINRTVDLPFGENCVVAIMSYQGYNQEDSVVINEAAIKRDLFNADTLKKYNSEIVKNPSTSQDDIFIKPDQNKVTGMKQGNYNKLNDKGYAPEETIIHNQDIIVGKVSPIQPTGNNNKVYKDSSTQFKSNVSGVIDRVHSDVFTNDGYQMYNVRVRMERQPVIGDKFCQKGDVNVLTFDGWKKLKDISLNDKVATMNDNGKLLYVNPSNKYEFDHDGEMYQYKNKHINIDCTLNHKLYVKDGQSKDYRLVEAQYCKGKMYRVKSFVDNDSKDIKSININNIEYDMDNILKLIGMYISDGSIDNNIVNISCLKDNKINFNKEYLNELVSINYNYSDGAIRINDRNILEFLQQFGRSAENKNITDEFMHLSKRQSRILLDSLIKDNEYRRFGSISKDLINNVSILAFNCGYSSSIHLCDNNNNTSGNSYYKIVINKKQTEPWANKKQNDSNTEKVYDYKGKVYCIEVPESHIYFMRNDMYSTPCWIGNSNRHG